LYCYDKGLEAFDLKKAAKLDDASNIDDARAADDNDQSRRAYYKEFVKVGGCTSLIQL
jgi:hypothetical protein